MSGLPPPVREHLGARSLAPLWGTLRERLERTGHAIRGSVTVALDDDGADRIAGLLGRPLAAGARRLALGDLDTALRHSAAERGLAAVVAELTGAALRDRPAERATRRSEWCDVWAELDDNLAHSELTRHGWSCSWTEWLHASGVVTRLGTDRARGALRAAVAVLTELDLDPRSAPAAPRQLGELASRATGTAHGLDDGRPLAVLVLRAAAIALEIAPPRSAAERRLLWQQAGVEPDAVSGTVLVWALRPPGEDAWSQMMRSRADLGLVTHLTARELRGIDVALTAPGDVVHACENPQVLQSLADAGVERPLACLSGNPSTAGLLVVRRAAVRYHGDFDWPGAAIARRVVSLGATPWRMGAADYRAAVGALDPGARLTLTGRAEPTPWDDELAADMTRLGVAVHEEAMISTLLADLR